MAWIRQRFKKGKVWVLADEEGQPVVKEGMVEIKYRPDDPKSYKTTLSRLEPLEPLEAVEAVEAGEVKAPVSEPAEPSSVEDAPSARPPRASRPSTVPIHVYTDGACSGNPGPAGIGVVLLSGSHRKEISEYIGLQTNNIAELQAVKRALETIKDRRRPVVIHSDSTYVIGVLTKGWNAKANQTLINDIKALMRSFTGLKFVKVEGHAGVRENERVDTLAREACLRGA